MLDLCQGAKAIFNTLTKCRRNIRTAIRNGIEVTEATTEEDVEAYWRLYLAWKQTERKRFTTIVNTPCWPRFSRCATTTDVSWRDIKET